MRNPSVALVALAAAASFDLHYVHAGLQRSSLHARQYITDSEVQPTYDYIIAGGGLAGLVLASRLSENPKNEVLVLEAGLSGDAVANDINAPAGTYYNSIVNTDYDWKHVTVPQPHLGNRTIGWPRGKILGGSSAMNAMYLVRPSTSEVNAWEQAIAQGGDKTAAKNWGWDNLYSYMKKAEKFTPPLESLSSVINITYDASTHGTSGPMQISYPAMMVNIVANWTAALAGAGISELKSPNGGTTLGGFITPSSINPANWTRSYSRSAYIDSLPPRSNLHILTEATVTRVVLSDSPDKAGNYYATAVEYAGSSTTARSTVNVRREAILAGGPLGTPKILSHSGVGPKDVLTAANVPVKVELPGVGQHLQDHLTAGVVWQTPLETAGNIHDSNSDFSRTAEFLSFINDAVAFVNASLLFNGPPDIFQKEIQDGKANSTQNLVPSTSPEVAEGYNAFYDLNVNEFLPNVGQVEMLMSVISPGIVSIQSAIQHPFSTGRVYINSSNPFDPILIDPQYFSHPADIVVMRQGVRLVRQVGAAFGATIGQEITPGPNIQSDADLDNWLTYEGASTQYHPTGSCAMLPKAHGGVVDANLRVYGLANVRIADSSVFPFEFAAHLASTTYGVAEQASVLIPADAYTVPGAPAKTNSSFMLKVPNYAILMSLITLLSTWMVVV